MQRTQVTLKPPPSPPIVKTLLFSVSIALLGVARAAEPKPAPITMTFYIANVQNDNDVAAIKDSLQQVKSVTDVAGLTASSGWAVISWNAHANGAQELAQAIADAKPSGSTMFEPTMKLRVPDYAKGDNAAKVDTVFANYAHFVKVEPLDRETGMFVIRFLPLKPDPATLGKPQGWSAKYFNHPIHDAPPAGLGLAIGFLREVPPKPPVEK